MNINKLGKKLKREAAANPKKAALLGLVTAVALYFWVPLVLGWVKKDAPGPTGTDAQSTAAAVPSEATNMPGPVAKAKTDAALPSWEQIAEWVRQDPRAKSAPPLQLARDPFASTRPEPKPAQDEAAESAEKPSLSPEDLGLVLTGTIIGPNSRIAQIGGKPYAVGQTVDVPKDKAAVSAAFKLIEVGPRRAVLQLGPQRFELTIPKPGDSEKIEIR